MSKMKESLQEYPEDGYEAGQIYSAEEAWVYATVSNVDDIIKRYGVAFFVEKLPRYSKIALTNHYFDNYEKLEL